MKQLNYKKILLKLAIGAVIFLAFIVCLTKFVSFISAWLNKNEISH